MTAIGLLTFLCFLVSFISAVACIGVAISHRPKQNRVTYTWRKYE